MISHPTRSALALRTMTVLSLVLATGCTATSTPEESASAPLLEAWVVVVAADDDPNELGDELPAPAPVDGVFREIVPTPCYVPTSGEADLSTKGYVVVLRGETEQSVAEAAETNGVAGGLTKVNVHCGS